jgi:hypothetical protein
MNGGFTSPGYHGGAILSFGALTVDNAVFGNNHVPTFGIGGAIYTRGTFLQVTRSTFSNNRASVGGALTTDALSRITDHDRHRSLLLLPEQGDRHERRGRRRSLSARRADRDPQQLHVRREHQRRRGWRYRHRQHSDELHRRPRERHDRR